MISLKGLGVGCLLTGIVLLILLGALVIRPILNVQSARCKVISSEYLPADMSCVCGQRCTSFYPCLQIYVIYSAEGKSQTALLYQDVYAVDKRKVRMTLPNLWHLGMSSLKPGGSLHYLARSGTQT